jgi:hypothetical protein
LLAQSTAVGLDWTPRLLPQRIHLATAGKTTTQQTIAIAIFVAVQEAIIIRVEIQIVGDVIPIVVGGRYARTSFDGITNPVIITIQVIPVGYAVPVAIPVNLAGLFAIANAVAIVVPKGIASGGRRIWGALHSGQATLAVLA